jgi:hypothetical protein
MKIPDLPAPKNWDELRHAVKQNLPEPEVNKILAILDENEHLRKENERLKSLTSLESAIAAKRKHPN